MCIKVIEVYPRQLYYVPNHFKAWGTCDRAASDDFFSLQFVPDWFVTQQQIDLQRDDDEYCNNDEMIEWCKGYKKRKAQNAKIK